MTRKTATVTQAKPTLPRAHDANGNELDGWGLPIAGPLRAARLADLGKPDPHLQPGAWPLAEAEALTAASDMKE